MREEVLHAIFLDLHKAYDTLDRSRCLDIMEVYGMGPRALRPYPLVMSVSSLRRCFCHSVFPQTLPEMLGKNPVGESRPVTS